MKGVNIHHIGIWVHEDDADEMLSFLTEVFGFRLMTRAPGLTGGERFFIHAGDNQAFEVLSNPHTEPRPEFPVHPTGRVGGIPHICLRVEDLPSLEETIKSLGYPITQKLPEQGYNSFELGSVRTIWFTGPGGVGFELFEFEEEYPFEKLRIDH